MMAALSCVDDVVCLTPRAEEAFQREAERVGGYAVDRDVAVQRSAAANFWADCLGVLADVDALSGKRGVA